MLRDRKHLNNFPIFWLGLKAAWGLLTFKHLVLGSRSGYSDFFFPFVSFDLLHFKTTGNCIPNKGVNRPFRGVCGGICCIDLRVTLLMFSLTFTIASPIPCPPALFILFF